jgi:ABC-type transport system substrate-binding protein
MRYLRLGGLLALLLNACSTPPAKQASSPIRIRWARDPETLDPLALPNQSAIDATSLLHLSLLQVDYQHNTFAPALAQELPKAQLVGDSLTLIDYRLRPAATWDDGQPVLATDVAFTLKLLQCPGLPIENSRAQFGFIRQIQLDPADPRHFVLVCRGQGAELLNASGDFSILPENPLDPAHTLRQLPLATLQDWPAARPPAPAVAALVRRYQQANLARQPEHLPGCGPYRLVSWETNQRLRFQRKDHWWGDALRPAPFVLQARPRQLVFVILPDDAAAVLALRRHELDLYAQIPARLFQQLQASKAAQQEFVFYTKPSYTMLMAGFNTQRPALHDRQTRQALSRLFDPAGLLAATQLGQGNRTVGLLPPSNPFYNDSLPLLSYSPAQATALLQQAGWQRQADGQWQRPGAAAPLALSLRYRTGDATHATVALQFQAAAAQIGIPIVLVPTENSVLTGSLQTGDFDLYISMLKGSPMGFNFAPILHSASVGNGNLTRFKQPATDQLLMTLITEGNERRKRLLLRRFQAMMQVEMPIVPLFFLPYRMAVSRQLRHVVASGLKPGYAAAALSWATPGAIQPDLH